MNRVVVGIGLAILFWGCLHYKMFTALIYLVNVFSLYDSITMLNYNFSVGIIFIWLSIKFNKWGFLIYQKDPIFVMKVIFITQVSDIYQYIVGIHLGKYKIGWISPNKTYEGYIGGFFLTLITFIWEYSTIDITVIYSLGILGGFISSLLKRIMKIKDYSNLLGSHGGWLDRIDSVVLPLLILS